MQSTNDPDIRSYIDYLAYEKRYSSHTLTSYSVDLREFFDYLNAQFGKLALKEINHGFVRSWLVTLKDDKLSSRTINRKISCLRSFFKYHLRLGRIEVSPMTQVITPKLNKRLPVFVKEEDVKKLVDAVNTATEDWKSLNAKMLIAIFYSTGMRLSELIGLREKQIDQGRSQVRVLGKGKKERIIPLTADILDMIRGYIDLKRKEFGDKGDTLLVTEKGKKLYPKYAYLLINRLLGQNANLDRNSPHVLRHTFATHLMNNGADLNAVKELLGHTSLASTQIYTHTTIEKLKDVHKKAHPKA